jgi:hypothetical protein
MVGVFTIIKLDIIISICYKGDTMKKTDSAGLNFILSGMWFSYAISHNSGVAFFAAITMLIWIWVLIDRKLGEEL